MPGWLDFVLGLLLGWVSVAGVSLLAYRRWMRGLTRRLSGAEAFHQVLSQQVADLSQHAP